MFASEYVIAKKLFFQAENLPLITGEYSNRRFIHIFAYFGEKILRMGKFNSNFSRQAWKYPPFLNIFLNQIFSLQKNVRQSTIGLLLVKWSKPKNSHKTVLVVDISLLV